MKLFKKKEERKLLNKLIDQNNCLNKTLNRVEKYFETNIELTYQNKQLIEQTKKLIEANEIVNENIHKIKENVDYFADIAELFAEYIIYDMGTRPHHNDRGMTILHIACRYQKDRHNFWNDLFIKM